MSEDFGANYITIEDEDGNEIELEILIDGVFYNDKQYGAYVVSNIDELPEDDPNYGMIILRTVEDDNGDFMFEDVDDEEELNEVYQKIVSILYPDEEDEEEEKEKE